MDKNKAFNILVEVTAKLSTDRPTHQLIEQALLTLKPEVKSEPIPEAPKKEDSKAAESAKA